MAQQEEQRALEPTTATAPFEARDDGAQPQASEGADAREGKPNLWSCKNLVLLLPVIINPFFLGYSNGIFGVYITMYAYATNCELYKARTACATLSGATCVWDATVGQCGWSAETTTCYTAYQIESDCTKDPVCKWSVSDKKCGNQVGYSSTYQGLFGAAMIIGGLVGSFFCGTLTTMLNFRLSLFCIGVLATIASVLMHVSTALFNFWVMFVARLILGFAVGWQNYASSAFVNTFAPKEYRVTFGTLFQCTMCLGAFIGPLVGVALGNTIQYSADRDAQVKSRMQGLVAVTTLIAVISMITLPLVAKNVDKPHKSDVQQTHDAGDVDDAKERQKQPGLLQMMRKMLAPCAIAVVMSATLQMTGISAVTNYAPGIMSSFSFDPLVGNVVLMTWNVITAFIVLPLSRVVPLRTLFLVGGLITATCCVFLCGVPVYPGVSSNLKAKNGVALAGIFVYIGVYQMCVGPSYFVLAIDMFPVSFKPYGMSIAIFTFTVFNTIVTLCYPIATENISGGPSGNPDKGQAIAFIFFGCIGFIALVIEYFFMHAWQEDNGDDNNQLVDGHDKHSLNDA